jgi:defect-in-organelle-trafficking protein DotB
LLLGLVEEAQSFDDINFGGERTIVIKSGGLVFRVGSRSLTSAEVESIANQIGKGSNVASDLYGGQQHDDSYQFTHKEQEIFRYRVNMASMRAGGGQQIKIAFRSIKSEIPTLDYVRIEQPQFDFMLNGAGIVIISGETGSGKTTTLAGIIGHIIRSGKFSKVISCYEQPVEYSYQPLVDHILESGADCSVEVYQHEIGSDLHSFIEGTRNAFRSNPDIIILGEAREYETVDAALLLGQSGHLVFITTHAKGVTNSISRLVNSFPVDRQPSANLGFLTTTKCIISQELFKKNDGTRLPVREQLLIPDSVQRAFGQVGTELLSRKFSDYFNEHGETFAQSAEKLHSQDLLNDEELNQILSREKIS